jgi:23S rRNA pseudouridine955/2504/2580 synthase
VSGRHGAGEESGWTGVRQVVAGDDDAGQRLDNFLLRLLGGVPRSVVYRVVRKGEVRVNGGRVPVSYRLEAGDRVRVPPVRHDRDTGSGESTGAPPPARELERLEARILFEDRRLLVLDKPAGMAVHGGSGIRFGVIEALRRLRPLERSLELVHRLDRDTSGCLLVAKKRSVLRGLHEGLRARTVDKRYLALARGDWQYGEHRVDAPLLTSQRRGGERFVTVDPAGKAARTMFRPVQLFGEWSLLEVTLETGRTHQIRVHAAHAGHPLAGDARYAPDERVPPGLSRLFLHAHSIAFDWPDTGEPFHASAPLDPALRQVLDDLESGPGAVSGGRGRSGPGR